jgi:adenylate cyclase
MSEQAPQRRLAAILAADVVGYSRMMQVDEAGTLAALKSRRTEILQPLVSKHHGRIIKVMGDGVLIEFASAVEAVSCAVALQEAMVVANKGVQENRRIVLRIGINLGDVMVEGGDLYGDGVNIAARLEGIAGPGAVVVSDKVRSEVIGKLGLRFEDLGLHSLKNMAEPIQVYRVVGKGEMAEPSRDVPAGKPSIAVLPFTNMSADPEQQYLSDGISEDIITELSRYKELLVIARNSSFQFRDRSIDMKRVARELGVGYLVEGSLRKLGNRLRITAQLVEATSDTHLWAERYDRSVDDIFAIQDQVTQTIAATLVGRVTVSSAEMARRKPTHLWAAYDYVLQRTQTDRAEALLRMAIEVDPGYARAYAAGNEFHHEVLRRL